MADEAARHGNLFAKREQGQMFFVRSAFWLALAFIVIHPAHIDLGAAAQTASSQAMAAGQHLIVSQILKSDCPLMTCADAAPHTALAPAAPALSPMQGSPAAMTAPIPQPRLHRIG